MSGVLAAVQVHGDTVRITDLSVTEIRASPTPASAGYQLTNLGKINKITTVGGTVAQGDWVQPNADAPQYEAFATLNSGSTSVGTTGSWVALSGTQTWQCNSGAGPAVKAADLTIKIRRVGTTTDLTTAHIILDAESN